jgi:hypothetical protein
MIAAADSALSAGALVAVVCGPDGVRYTASGADQPEVVSRLLAYVGERCEDVLWPSDAREVRRLIAAGQDQDAVELYFATVGERWDAEWLATPLW